MTHEQRWAIMAMADRFAASRRAAAWAEVRAGWTDVDDDERRERLYAEADRAGDAARRQRKALQRIVNAS